MPTDKVVAKLDEAARRGRLAGFELGDNGILFKTSAFGHPFEGELEARAGGSTADTTRLQFSTRMKMKLFWIVVVVLVVSIWPGAPITKSLLASLIPSWPWLWQTTYWWYLPLSILGAPWTIWSYLKRSRKEIAVSAVEMAGKVQKELGAVRVEAGGG
jgi:hypothetical protein